MTEINRSRLKIVKAIRDRVKDLKLAVEIVAFAESEVLNASINSDLRDYFAAAALQAMAGTNEPHIVARAAYAFADAMLSARGETR